MRRVVLVVIAMFAASCGYAAPHADSVELAAPSQVAHDYDAVSAADEGGVMKVSMRGSEAPVLEAEVLALVNRERYRAGLNPLRPSSELAAAARDHNEAMEQGGFFEHRGRGEADLYDRVIASGLDTDHVGENIFETSASGDREVASLCVKMWMLSRGHRRNMLEPEFGKTGIAIGTAADGTEYITEDFAH